jgi:hypothetical protein
MRKKKNKRQNNRFRNYKRKEIENMEKFGGKKEIRVNSESKSS